MKSFTLPSFWKEFNNLPTEIQILSKEKFKLWLLNPFHPGLHFKCVNTKEDVWSIRIGRSYRALGVRDNDEIIWFWIGDHEGYEKLIK
jgi:hypothetical protein